MQILPLKRNYLLRYGILMAGVCCMLGSCSSTNHIALIQGKFDTARLSQISVPEPVIHKGDLLSIIVYSDNPSVTALYNQTLITMANSGGTDASSTGSGGSGASLGPQISASPTTSGYLVDNRGNIQFQSLGSLNVEGLTKAQLSDTLSRKLTPFLKNPYFTIRFLNYRFTLLGELARPGMYSIPGERVSILEALGMAGDLTIFGRRDNVMFIRENNGKREFARLDLTKPDIMASPYFYLQPNDVVYVETSKRKILNSDQSTYRTVSIGVALLSALAVIFSLARNN